MENETWKHEIRIDLLNMFRDNPEDFPVLLSFLDNPDNDYPGKAAAWSLLRVMRDSGLRDKMRLYANEIVKEEKNRRQRNSHQHVATANCQDEQQDFRRLPTVTFDYMQRKKRAHVGFGTGFGAAAKALVYWLIPNSKILNLEVDIATENAYRYFDLDHHATLEQIGIACEAKMMRNIEVENNQERIIFNVHRIIIEKDQRQRFGNVLLPLA